VASWLNLCYSLFYFKNIFLSVIFDIIFVQISTT
jgi:hypothetical protein